MSTSINRMIVDTLRELDTIDAIKAGAPMGHEEAYDGYELRIDTHEDPRDWFGDLR